MRSVAEQQRISERGNRADNVCRERQIGRLEAELEDEWTGAERERRGECHEHADVEPVPDRRARLPCDQQTAETIVAINRDPDTPIAELADLMVVGDLFDVGNAVLAELRSRSG